MIKDKNKENCQKVEKLIQEAKYMVTGIEKTRKSFDPHDVINHYETAGMKLLEAAKIVVEYNLGGWDSKELLSEAAETYKKAGDAGQTIPAQDPYDTASVHDYENAAAALHAAGNGKESKQMLIEINNSYRKRIRDLINEAKALSTPKYTLRYIGLQKSPDLTKPNTLFDSIKPTESGLRFCKEIAKMRKTFEQED